MVILSGDSGFASIKRLNTSEECMQFYKLLRRNLSKLRIVLKNEKKRNIYMVRFKRYGWRGR